MSGGWRGSLLWIGISLIDWDAGERKEKSSDYVNTFI
jgi:hypothetical protein